MPSWQPDWSAWPAPLLEFWTERHVCSLSTLDPGGRPHAVPVGAALDHELRCAWIITGGGTQKVANLRRDPRLAINQVDGARWSTIVGTAEVLSDADAVARACAHYAERYKPPRANPERVAVRVTLTRVLGSRQVLPDA